MTQLKVFYLVATLFIGQFFSLSLQADMFQITLLRAAPGNLSALLQECKSLRDTNHGNLSIMRHSQGDHWDLMLIEPSNMKLHEQHSFKSMLAFQHSFISSSDSSWQSIKSHTESNELYHIEMFYAVAGKKQALIEQRAMENAYYHATQRAGNMIFTTVFGSDMDVFTVGFYKDLKTFATDPDLAESVFEKAAIDAGFKSRSTIGLYLRELLSSHNDTLAARVD